MAYLCRDCSYRGKRRSDAGACPACGSFNYKNLRPQSSREIVETRKGRLLILVLLWGYLFVLVYRSLHGA